MSELTALIILLAFPGAALTIVAWLLAKRKLAVNEPKETFSRTDDGRADQRPPMQADDWFNCTIKSMTHSRSRNIQNPKQTPCSVQEGAA